MKLTHLAARLFSAAIAHAVISGLAVASEGAAAELEAFQRYKQVVDDTAAMVSDPRASFLAMKYKMHVLNVLWEDTGRFYHSAVGPNISDVTIQVQQRDPTTDQYRLTCMPVIRFPNFTDETADLPLEKFILLVGNEKGKPLTKVSLKEFLAEPGNYLSNPDSWKGGPTSLLAPRDTHALVSAQACFLPIPKEEAAEFNPVIFNYQSSKENPAVLAILATRQGASVTVIDNRRDSFQTGFAWGQRLFFNKAGERTSLTGRRKSDYDADKRRAQREGRPMEDMPVEAAGEKSLNMVLLIQVPLKHKAPGTMSFGGFGGGGGFGAAPAEPAPPPLPESDVEEAVIGHGKVEGPFTEIDSLTIRRDPRFPVRVTVQFYQATSNGVVSDEDMARLAAQINRVYQDADFVGSLVVDGPSNRPTEHEASKVEPPWWWEPFWRRHEKSSGMTREQTLHQLQQQFGPAWRPDSRREMLDAVRRLDADAIPPPPPTGGPPSPGGLFE